MMTNTLRAATRRSYPKTILTPALSLCLGALLLNGCEEQEDALTQACEPATISALEGELETALSNYEMYMHEGDRPEGDDDCARAAEVTYEECIDAGGSEEDCSERAAAAYEECMDGAEVPETDDECDRVSEVAYEECIDAGESEEDCRERAAAAYEECIQDRETDDRDRETDDRDETARDDLDLDTIRLRCADIDRDETRDETDEVRDETDEPRDETDEVRDETDETDEVRDETEKTREERDEGSFADLCDALERLDACSSEEEAGSEADEDRTAGL
jgi:hypothetical protein